MTILGIFDELLSTQNVNVARFARHVECDFFVIFKQCVDIAYFAGCGVATGWGAVFNNVKMEPQKSVAVFGLGALGLSVIQV